LIPILVGTALAIVGLALLVKTNILFSAVGKGTLAPWDPTKKLVVVGIYTHVRNPMLLGVYFALMGESVLLGSISVSTWFLASVILNHFYIIKKEEPGLLKRFGNEYREYKRNVPRWIPRLKPWIPPATRTAVKHRYLSRKKKSRNKPL
jgi:protein-S-isoprenylcysteine O-methyltransferase Ste14